MYEEDGCLSPFRIDKSEISGNVRSAQQPHYFHFTVTKELKKPEGEPVAVYPDYRVYAQGAVRYIGTVYKSWLSAYIRAEHRGKWHEVQLRAADFPDRIGVKTVLTSLGAEHLVAEADGFILHSAYIEWNGKAILFTAPSETGKSTQADLWHDLRGAEIINGDRSVIRVVNGEILAAGLPFAGSSHYCKNRTLPVAAIVYLQQSSVVSIRRLTGVEAFRKLWEGISANTWNKKDLEKISWLVQQTAVQVPVYQLACTPDESAVNALEQMLER